MPNETWCLAQSYTSAHHHMNYCNTSCWQYYTRKHTARRPQHHARGTTVQSHTIILWKTHFTFFRIFWIFVSMTCQKCSQYQESPTLRTPALTNMIPYKAHKSSNYK